MIRSALVALTGLAGLMASVCGSGLAEVGATPISYKLPNETAEFKPGPNLEIVKNNCTACHRPTMSRPNLAARNSSETSGRQR
jgi:hypothetical protein